MIGWGKDSKSGKSYWQMRNSWGEFWGEMGYAKVEKGEMLFRYLCAAMRRRRRLRL